MLFGLSDRDSIGYLRRDDEACGELRYSTRSKNCPGVMSTIPDFNDTALWIVRSAMTEPYDKTVGPAFADSPSRRDLDSPTLSVCPTVYHASFVICRSPNHYRPQRFMASAHSIRTGRDHYTNLRLN